MACLLMSGVYRHRIEVGELKGEEDMVLKQLDQTTAELAEARAAVTEAQQGKAEAAMAPQKASKTAELAAMHSALKQLTDNRLTSMFHRLDRTATGTISKEVAACCLAVKIIAVSLFISS